MKAIKASVERVLGTTKEALIYIVSLVKDVKKDLAEMRAAQPPRQVFDELLQRARETADWQQEHDARHETAIRQQREATSAWHRSAELRYGAIDDKFRDYDVAIAELRARGYTGGGGGDAGSAPAAEP